MQSKINRLTAENVMLLEQINSFEFNEKMFEDKDERVHFFFTGLPSFTHTTGMKLFKNSSKLSYFTRNE